ncbi:type II secretion system F family protein [Brevibacillus daliensis]|uniref:type II secretion system F family protein n=1 Tax=Brevibacillus daliensis TaxID=2892995 RepID=UPI001E32AB47|nr:type II secretion system F family protein [Brevibacillus daliensis]
MAILSACMIVLLIVVALIPYVKVANVETRIILQERVDSQLEASNTPKWSENMRVNQAIRWLSLPEKTDQIARRVGFDSKDVSKKLSRLRWKNTTEEWLLFKISGACLLCVSLLIAAIDYATGIPLSTIKKMFVGVAVLSYFAPNLILNWYDQRAKEEMERQIPLFFSIVMALVNAGMPIHTAMRKSATRFPKRLGQEIAWLEIEEKQYGNWRKALEALALKWELNSFISIVTDIQEALTKGVSIGGMLQVHVEEQLRRQEDEITEQVNRMSVRLLPMVILFMGVPLMYLVLAPSFMGIQQNL